MSDEDDTEKALGLADLSIEFWASSLDAFLQDFRQSVVDADMTRAIVCSARLAQLGSCLTQFFREGAVTLMEQSDGSTNKDMQEAFNSSCRPVAVMCAKHIDKLDTLADPDGLKPPDSGPVTKRIPDRSMN